MTSEAVFTAEENNHVDRRVEIVFIIYQSNVIFRKKKRMEMIKDKQHRK